MSSPDKDGAGISWLRILLEGVVIVSSILLAFGIDAWWDETRDRRLVEEHLVVLIAELSRTADEIELGINGTERVLGATLEILGLMSGKVQTPDSLDFSELYQRSMNVGAFFAQDAALTTIMTSGEILDLNDPELLRLLGIWQNQLESLELDSQHLERNREETILNRLIDVGVDATGFYLHQPLAEGYDKVVVVSPTAERQFLSDPGLQTAMAMRADRSARLIRDYHRALVHLRSLLTRLEGGIDGSGT